MGAVGKELWDEVLKFAKVEQKSLKIPSYIAAEIEDDFKWFLFSLSRYKFAGKMLEGKKRVLEIGCSCGFKTRMLSQFVEYVMGVDFDKDAIDYAKEHYETENRKYIYQDALEMNVGGGFDAIVCLDVIEHIEAEQENIFMKKILSELEMCSICIIGTPNITAAKYQSELSKVGHINLYSHNRLRTMMNRYFYHVLMFSMNDEVVHTGFGPMANYLFAVGIDKK